VTKLTGEEMQAEQADSYILNPQEFYCNECGYQDTNIKVEFLRTVANGNIVACPLCTAEILSDAEE
jgi:predicted Zn-ribbon and HTH transcriptional regulator